MVRVPDFPPKPTAAILTVRQHLEAGYQVISHCSAFPATHKHVVNLEAALAAGATAFYHDWSRAQVCRECGAPGGGTTITIHVR
jgi:hypothetical protein